MILLLFPNLGRDCLGGQHFDPPGIQLHHVHDRIAENDFPQLGIGGELCLDVVFRSQVVAILCCPQHDQPAGVRKHAGRNSPTPRPCWLRPCRCTAGPRSVWAFAGFECCLQCQSGSWDGGDEIGHAIGARERGSIEVQQGSNVGFVRARNRVALVDKGEKKGFTVA